MILNSPYITGSVVITKDATIYGALLGPGFASLVSTASYNANSASVSTRITNTEATASSLTTASGSYSTRVTSLETASGSFSTRVVNLETTSSVVSGSYAAASASLSTRVTTAESTLNTVSSSYAATSASVSSRVKQIEDQYATTGSNTFTGTQNLSNTTNATGFTTTAALYTAGGLRVTKDAYISSSLYIKGDLTVYGTQSISYITASQLNIANNIISVNTALPSVRFGGLAVYDSGSSALTGSLLWDSQNNSWIYSNPSGSGNYDSAMVIMGPRNASALGSEVGLSCNYLVQGHGHHHTTSSMIFHDGSVTCFPGTVCSNTLSTTDGTNTSTLANNFLRFNGGDFYFDACAVGGNINFRTSNAGALDNTALFICGANSRVGIGTNTPSDLLTLQKNDGRLRFNTSAGTRVLYLGDDFGNGGFQQIYDSAGAVKVTLSAGVSYFNGGNVGIGCTNPSYPLDVKGAAGNIARITDGTSHITFYAGSGLNEIATVSPMLLSVNGAEALRITTGKQFIVGATSMAYANSIGYVAGFMSDFTGQSVVSIARKGQTLASQGMFIGIDSTSSYLWNRDNVAIQLGTNDTTKMTIACTGQVTFACLVCAPQYITTQGSSVSYAAGTNYIVWNSESEYCVQDNNTGGTYSTMKCWVADRTGCLTLRFTGYIQSGPNYWAWRVTKNGTSSLVCGYYISPLAPGCSSSVHAYTTFQSDIGPVNPGDCIALQMVSSNGGGTPVSGAGQYLFAKELRLHSTTPNLSGGSINNVFGDWVGIGTCTPYSNLYINGNNDAAYDATVDNGQDGCGVTLTVRNNSTVTNSFSQLNLQVSGDSGRAVGRIALIRTASATGDMAFITENGNTKAEKMRITAAGQVAIGTTSTSTEANLFLGAQSTTEGGQLVLQKGTSCSCATHLDNYQDAFRVLVGTDTSSNGVHMLIDHKTRNTCLYGTLILNPSTISNNNAVFGTSVNGGYQYFNGNLANGEKFGSQGGTYVQGFYFISWYSTSGRGYAIFATVTPAANAGTVLVSSGGWATVSASYNAASAISLAFDGSNRGPVLSNNTGVTVTFYSYVFGGV